MSGVSKYGADAPEPPIEFEDGEQPDSLWKHLFSPKLCIYVLFYTCLTTRINSFPSWAYPWFQSGLRLIQIKLKKIEIFLKKLTSY